jgi:hypothetical protein
VVLGSTLHLKTINLSVKGFVLLGRALMALEEDVFSQLQEKFQQLEESFRSQDGQVEVTLTVKDQVLPYKIAELVRLGKAFEEEIRFNGDPNLTAKDVDPERVTSIARKFEGQLYDLSNRAVIFEG